MNLEEILAKGGVALAVLLTLVQIAPVKINPWSWLAKILGRAINGELFAKMDSLEKKADNLEKEFGQMRQAEAEKDAIACRTRILRFGDEAFHDVKHSKEHFDQILRDITAYEQYCESHPEFENNQAVLTCSRIKEIYKKLLKTGGFL